MLSPVAFPVPCVIWSVVPSGSETAETNLVWSVVEVKSVLTGSAEVVVLFPFILLKSAELASKATPLEEYTLDLGVAPEVDASKYCADILIILVWTMVERGCVVVVDDIASGS